MVVNKSVTTLLVTTHVDVTLDMSWMEMDSLAMVHKTDINSLIENNVIQILMSVPVTMVAVHKSVPTLLVATHVDATLDMTWMDSLAMVKSWTLLKACLPVVISHIHRYQ